jgi:hypothetical protein
MPYLGSIVHLGAGELLILYQFYMSDFFFINYFVLAADLCLS